MSAVLLRLRSELRSRWRSVLTLALLLGVSSGVVLTAAIGARRTQTAYPRLIRETEAMDALVGLLAPPPVAEDFFRRLSMLPQVERLGRVPGIRFLRVDPSGHIDYTVKALAPADDVAFAKFARDKFLAGRGPDPNRADEVELNRPLAELLGLHVGDLLTGFRVFPANRDPRSLEASDGTPVTLRVVGIGVTPSQLLADSHTPYAAIAVLSNAFYRLHVDAVDFPFALVQLRGGAADVPAFHREFDRLVSRFPGLPAPFSNQHEGTVRAERAIRPLAAALAIFALFAGLGTLLAVGQAFSRDAVRESAEYPALRAIGMSRRQRFALPILRAVLIGLSGGVIGVVVAGAASGLLPVGSARIAEPHPGFLLNAGWLAGGFGCIVASMLAVAAIPAWRCSTVSDASLISGTRPARLSERLIRACLSTAPTIGLLLLRRGRGNSSVPLRSTIAGATVAVAAVTLVFTFGSNLHTLVTSPRLYGQDWDLSLDAETTPMSAAATRAMLSSDPDVESFSGGTFGQVAIGALSIPALGVEARHGAPYPTLLSGRQASEPDEIVLGRRVLRQVGRRVGDRMSVLIGTKQFSMRIVGVGVFPKFALGAFLRPELGDGAVVLPSVIEDSTTAGGGENFTFLLVRFRERVDRKRAEAQLGELIRPLGPCPFGPCLVSQQRPDDITAYSQVQRAPALLAAVLAALAVAALGHALITMIRVRRRDISILMALGMTGRQVSTAVSWQGTGVAFAAASMGIPAGVIAGRWTWRLFAGLLGIPNDASVPIVGVVLIVPAMIMIANLIAAGPARTAGRIVPAVHLRTE